MTSDSHGKPADTTNVKLPPVLPAVATTPKPASDCCAPVSTSTSPSSVSATSDAAPPSPLGAHSGRLPALAPDGRQSPRVLSPALAAVEDDAKVLGPFGGYYAAPGGFGNFQRIFPFNDATAALSQEMAVASKEGTTPIKQQELLKQIAAELRKADKAGRAAAEAK